MVRLLPTDGRPLTLVNASTLVHQLVHLARAKSPLNGRARLVDQWSSDMAVCVFSDVR